MKIFIPAVYILFLLSLLGVVSLFLWALFKFGRNYKYERDDPLSTLPKNTGFLELISPKTKNGIFRTKSKEPSEKTEK